MLRSFGFLAILQGSSALECHKCRGKVDSNGDLVSGDESCWTVEADETFVVTCEEGKDLCGIEIYSDWAEIGQQYHEILRGCMSSEDFVVDTTTSCVTTDAGIIGHTRDCIKTCDSDKCNTDDLLKMMETDMATNNVAECNVCNGKDECLSDDNQAECPFYADNACFNHRTEDIAANGETDYRIIKGCSAFSQKHECHVTTTDDTQTGTHQLKNCRSTCQEELCNYGEPKAGLMCYRCEYHMDHTGKMIGLSDPTCWNGEPSDEHAVECDDGEQCLLDMQIDWPVGGYQEVIVRRRCGTQADLYPGQNGCYDNLQFPLPEYIYRDCSLLCDGDRCNGAEHFEEVSLQHSSGREPGSLECHTCSFTERPDSSVSGNENCRANAMETPTTICPTYADTACFTAGHWTNTTVGDKVSIFEEDHRGCSSFHFDNFNNNNGDCHTSITGNTVESNCKYTCSAGSQCNQSPLAKRRQCHTCNAAIDVSGAPVGTTNNDCWDDPRSTPILECEYEDDICAVEIIVDWFTRGNHLAQVKRGCVRADQKTECSEGSTGRNMFKDCTKPCVGNACNTYTDEVSEMFNPDGPSVDSCLTCFYTESDGGYLNGNVKCLDNPKEFSAPCPAYANRGCFLGSNAHVWGDTEVAEEIYRGCSTFVIENDVCYDENLSSITGELHAFGICKSACEGRNCNDGDRPEIDIPIEGDYPICQECSVAFDQNNNTIGTGDLDCIEGHKRFNQLCPNKGDICLTQMTADWQARGRIDYRLVRSCSSGFANVNCFEGQSNLLSYKDCEVQCDPKISGAGCNKGLDDVSEKFSTGTVSECFACEYFEKDDGNVQGIPNCLEEINPLSTKIPIHQCPKYADTSCYHAASFHSDYLDNGNDFEDDYRGCAPFAATGSANRPYCVESTISGFDHKNCKEVCQNDLCNTNRINKAKRCYTCQETRNAQNETIGVSNPGCFDKLDDSMIADCAQDEDYCFDDMVIDWMPKGEQQIWIKRGCSATPAPGPCESGEGQNVKYKDCQASCYPTDDQPCNNDLSVAEKYRIGAETQVTSCHTCRYVEHDNGDVEGNKNCELRPAVGDCPIYADIACYTGAATHNAIEAGNIIREIYKGCSTFVAKNGEEDKMQELPNPDSGTVQMFGITKTSCTSNNCNKEHKAPQEPEIPEDPEPENKNRCQVCQVTVDQYERQIGVGQIGCWNGDAAFEQDCGTNEYCVVDMEVDWLPRGHFNYRVVRGCRATPAPENCYTAGSNLVQYKDCSVSCKIEDDGPGCNDGLTNVAMKFSVGNVSECYRCEYYEDYNGNVAGFPFCGDEIDVGNTQVELYSCPLFADAACYWAGSYHDDYSDVSLEFEDDFRGCSPFTLGRNDECVSNSINGLDHLNCKGTCEEDGCNTDEILRHLQCNQCQTTVDAEGNLVGSGDRRCFDNPGTEFMADCPAGTTHCTDHMMVDWFSRGFQYYTMTRGCAPIDDDKDYDRPMDCSDGMSSKFVFRDCYAFCKEDGCNNDMTAGELHQDEEGYLETSCFTCNFVEADDGTVSGNTNCPDTPTDDLKKSCPTYANQACFTGTAIHNFDGEDKEEVYKGCSAFNLGTPLYDTDEISGIQYRLIKETCRGPNCNEGHLGGSDNPSCHVCTTRKDHLGNIINGDEDCWSDQLDDVSKFMQNCFNEDDVCITELTVDWIPKGEQVATLQRRCGPRPTLPGGNVCSEISTDAGMEKRCISYCDTTEDGDLCNNDLSVEDDFDAGDDAVSECYGCLYGEWYNGNVLEGSNIYCQAPDATGLVPVQSCPKYLNAACYTAATWHSVGNNDFEEDYKGCSAFKLEDNTETCSDYVVNGIIYKNCKSTCDDDNCNNITPTKTMSCYTCDHTLDAEGNSVGLAAMESCFNDVPHPSYIQECAPDENFCKSDLESDWFFGGMMTWRIRRGCAKSAASGSCTEFSHNSDQMHFKDCQTSCMGANCNTGLNALFNKFDSGRTDELSCYACSYLENDDGSASGNRFCMDEADKVIGAVRTCPRYANHGCFVGSNLHENQDGNQVEQVYKGCSSFVVQSPICDIQYDFNAGPDTYDLAVCKEFCNEGLCNREHNRPELDDSNYQRCYTCQATQDHSGNNVGSGDPNCWSNPTSTESQICDTDDVCLAQVTVDWSAMGEQLVHISRGCRAPRDTPIQGIPCTEVTSSDGTFHVKTCEETCDESECIVDFETIENHFDQGNDITCYDCIYGKLTDGSFLPNSNINCREPVASDETVPLKQCPKLMNAACFTASSFHTSIKGEYDRDFKGCSAFKLDSDNDDGTSDDECITYTSNGEVHTTCKQTCSGDKCNSVTPTKVLSCYTCDTTVDGLNNTIGYGQSDCWSESPNPKYIEECKNGEEYCKTDIEADWLINGKQSWRIRRGCSNGPAPQSCYEFSGNGMHLKDCTTTCSKSGCNDGLYKTAALYDQPGPSFNCYTCEHIQNENGIDSGNSNCGDEPDKIEDASKLCPVYANAACYAGTNAHYDSEAVLYEQVYKGCSTFTVPETECGTLKDITIDGNKADYGVCKETCFGNNCNRYHEHPTINSKSCYSCSIMKDHMGNTLGYADENCWENPSPLDRIQCASDDICLTEMKVEWFPKGEQIMSFERKCGKLPEDTGAFVCNVETDELYKKKHCVKKCSEEADNCNNDREIEELFYDDKVNECFECTYGVFYDGTTLPNSNKFCQNPTAQEGVVPVGSCPKYASTACYTAATWHFAQHGTEYEEDFKGCSAFVMDENEDECASYIQNGLTYNNCRQTCSGDKCNRNTPTRRQSCYTCSVTVDALNNTLGFGDASCFSETPNPNNVKECASGQDYCVSTMISTWEWDGSMTWSITRGCSFNPAVEDCNIINGESVTTKMCGMSCTDSSCNTGLTPIASKFSSGNVNSCYVCDYLENDDGSVSGNQNCPDNADQLPGGASKCPIYADSACFTGSNAHYSTDMVLREQIHKGCSSFSSVYMRQSPQTDKKCDVHKEILVDGVEYDYGVCRETCGTSNCNVDHEIAVIDRTECYSCSVQKDFMGNIIGQGDGSCWSSPNPADTEYCTGDQICLTEMTVEWWSKGEQTVSLQRRCGNKPANDNWACGVTDMSPYLAKSCNVACDGDLCNDNIDIEDLFAENNVEECFSCTYGEFYNGNTLPNSNLYCTNPIADSGTVPTQKCPKYATSACFTAATWHYASNGAEMEEDFKGCSAFKLDTDDLQCDNYIINGITYNNCRSTCDDDNCNRITPQKKKSCFTCAATFDAEMNLIGYGESSCYSNSPNPALIQECDNEDDYCITDLEADWFLNGRQEYRIRRGCSEKPIDEGCMEGSASNDQMLYKDCTKTCSESFCNDDFDSVASLFSTGRDLTCYSCKYIEYFDGAVSGNKKCGDNPDLIPGTQPKCPVFADAGCFTGTNAQYNAEMTVIEEVYKGCSSFAYPSPKCDVLLGINVPGQDEPGTMGICKEGCTGDLCNKEHITPEIP